MGTPFPEQEARKTPRWGRESRVAFALRPRGGVDLQTGTTGAGMDEGCRSRRLQAALDGLCSMLCSTFIEAQLRMDEEVHGDIRPTLTTKVSTGENSGLLGADRKVIPGGKIKR